MKLKLADIERACNLEKVVLPGEGLTLVAAVRTLLNASGLALKFLEAKALGHGIVQPTLRDALRAVAETIEEE